MGIQGCRPSPLDLTLGHISLKSLVFSPVLWPQTHARKAHFQRTHRNVTKGQVSLPRPTVRASNIVSRPAPIRRWRKLKSVPYESWISASGTSSHPSTRSHALSMKTRRMASSSETLAWACSSNTIATNEGTFGGLP